MFVLPEQMHLVSFIQQIFFAHFLQIPGIPLDTKDKQRQVRASALKKKKWYKWTYLQNRNRLTDLEIKFMVTKGEMWGEGIN